MSAFHFMLSKLCSNTLKLALSKPHSLFMLPDKEQIAAEVHRFAHGGIAPLMSDS